MKKALIFGVNGQDGSFMHDLLLEKGYEVYGYSSWDKVESKEKMFAAIEKLRPQEIYNFAGISNVINPYENLDELFQTNALLPQWILEAIVKVDKSIKFFQASSCLVFGRDNSGHQNENTPASPMYPYGAAKLYAQNMVKEFRETFNLFACSGIFFNHESEKRKEHFFSRKICKAAATKTKVKVGDLRPHRDFGYAKDYMEAAYMMMQSAEPRDYCIGTGNIISMREFAYRAFESVGENYRDFVECDEQLARRHDTGILKADIRKIKAELGWQPKTTIDDMIKIMIQHDRQTAQGFTGNNFIN